MSLKSPVVELVDIGRQFGDRNHRVIALDGVSFSVEEGQTVALLGVNGAGKTTVTKILSTLLLPSTGMAFVGGFDVAKQPALVRRQVGVVFGGEQGLYPRLTGSDNVRFFGMLAGLSRSDIKVRVPELMDSVGLSSSAGRRVETYSKGMRQRLHIAIGLIARPSVLLLDEPTIGLDPDEAQRLRDRLLELKSAGVTIILTSHYLLDVEQLADRVVMLHAGSVAADLTLDAFSKLAGHAANVDMTLKGKLRRPEDAEHLRVDFYIQDATTTRLGLEVASWNSGSIFRLGEIVKDQQVVDIRIRTAGLEEAFSQLVRIQK